MIQELTAIDTGPVMDLQCSRPPAMVIEEARKAAVALKDVLDKKPDKVMMNGQQYLEFEDWATVAQFYGCKVRIVSTSPVQLGDVMGFEAKAECFHVGSGKVVSSADAMCLNDEEKWSARNKYAWAYCKKSGGHSVDDPGKDEIVWEPKRNGTGNAPKKEKVLTGQEKVPLFQLRSMAQTRAGGKAFRHAFSWVVVLAGYKATPAEELGGDADRVENCGQLVPPINVTPTVPTPDGHGKAASVLDKMKPAVPPVQQPMSAEPKPTITPQQLADRMEMAESVAELSGVMNTAVTTEMSADDRAALKQLAEQHMARLRLAKKG